LPFTVRTKPQGCLMIGAVCNVPFP